MYQCRGSVFLALSSTPPHRNSRGYKEEPEKEREKKERKILRCNAVVVKFEGFLLFRGGIV